MDIACTLFTRVDDGPLLHAELEAVALVQKNVDCACV